MLNPPHPPKNLQAWFGDLKYTLFTLICAPADAVTAAAKIGSVYDAVITTACKS